MDIECKWYIDDEYIGKFEKGIWNGKIILFGDGWFEGIVVDQNSSYTEDRFIFGVYHPEKVIELFKFTPTNISYPFVFHGKREDNGYSGQFETIGLFGTMPCGISYIITQYPEVVKENTEIETDELKKKIQRYKQSIMDETGKEFYNNSIAMRNSMCQIILRNYEGRGFNSEETQQIMEECQPVNDRVMTATEKEAKRLVKNNNKKIKSDISI